MSASSSQPSSDLALKPSPSFGPRMAGLVFYGIMGILSLCVISIGFSERLMAYGPAAVMMFGFIVFGKLCARHHGRIFMREYGMVVYLAMSLLALIWASLFWSVLPDLSASRAGKLSFLILAGLGFLYVITIYQNQNLNMPLLQKIPDLQNRILGVTTLCAFIIAVTAVMVIDRQMLGDGYRQSFMNKPLGILFLLSVPWILIGAGLINKADGTKMARFYKIVPVGLVICLAMILPITASQSVWLCTLAIVILYVLHRYIPWRVLMAICAGTWICLALIFPWVMHVWGDDMLQYIAHNEFLLQFQKTGAPFARLEMWTGAGHLIAQHPIFGHGINTFRGHILPIDALFMGGNIQLNPHNFISQFWFEFGIFGAIWMVVALAGIFRHLAKMDGPGGVAGFYLVNLLLLQLSISYGFWQSWNIGFIFFLIGYVVLVIRKKQL